EASNLHRQWLFEESDAADALPKAAAAAMRIARINSSIQARGVVADLTPSNAAELLGGADLILDGTDNFETRYLINDFAVSPGVPHLPGRRVPVSHGVEPPAGEPVRQECSSDPRAHPPHRPAGTEDPARAAGPGARQ